MAAVQLSFGYTGVDRVLGIDVDEGLLGVGLVREDHAVQPPRLEKVLVHAVEIFVGSAGV
jgi:hypothetical protein